MENPYEKLKELTRGHRITPEQMRQFVTDLGLPAHLEEALVQLTPATYTGVAADLARAEVAAWRA